MPTKTHTLIDGTQVKLGAKIPTAPAMVLRLSDYLGPVALDLPDELDLGEKARRSLSRMYYNDRMGCCCISGKAHQLGIWSANDSDSEGEVEAMDAEIVSQYQTICGPGDNGCYISRVNDHMIHRGLQANGKIYKADGYVAIDPKSQNEMKLASLIFGSLDIGMMVPANYLRTPNGGTWDIDSSPNQGGHFVVSTGYNHQGLMVSTWGGLRLFTWRALARYVFECYVMLAPLWYGNDKIAPSGLRADRLRADLEKLKRGILPDVPTVNPEPDPEPTPNPVPVPPPEPEPDEGDNMEGICRTLASLGNKALRLFGSSGIGLTDLLAYFGDIAKIRRAETTEKKLDLALVLMGKIAHKTPTEIDDMAVAWIAGSPDVKNLIITIVESLFNGQPTEAEYAALKLKANAAGISWGNLFSVIKTIVELFQTLRGS